MNENTAVSIPREAAEGCKKGAGKEDAQSDNKIHSCNKDSSLTLLLHHSFTW